MRISDWSSDVCSSDLLLRAAHPDLPVIMCSTLTEQGASATFEALSLGASDYVTKPSNGGGMDAAMAQLSGDLIPKVRALCASVGRPGGSRSEEHTSELQSLMHISYAVFCLQQHKTTH